MKSCLFLLALIVAFVCAIPTPAKACNIGAAVQLQSAVACPSVVLAPAFVLAQPVAVQAVQFQAVQTCPSVSFAAQSYGSASFAAQSSYGIGAETFSVARRGRFRGRGLGARGLGLGFNALGGLGSFANEVAIDPLTGLPVEVVDPLLGGLGGRLRGNALGRRGRGRAGRSARGRRR